MSEAGTHAPRPRAAVVALFAVLVLLSLEGMSYGVGRVLQLRGVFYNPVGLDDYEAYLAERDPEMGWPSPDAFGPNEWDASRSRLIPAFPDPSVGNCASIYGDSFAWGSEVTAEHAAPNVLSGLLGCRVGNYGAGGVGTDQAFMRFLANADDAAGVVVLTHLSENILRVLNQYRALISNRGVRGLKPRFRLTRDGIARVPIPDVPADRYRAFVADPGPFLSHEFFLPGGASGKQWLKFPFTLSMLRAPTHYGVRAALMRRPRYAEFYTPGHASRGTELVAEIARAFIAAARERGKHPYFAVLPTGQDLRLRAAGEPWSYAPLLPALAERGIAPIEVGENMLRQLAGEPPCSLFDDCDKHYNERGYAIMAETIAERIAADGLAPRP